MQLPLLSGDRAFFSTKVQHRRGACWPEWSGRGYLESVRSNGGGGRGPLCGLVLGKAEAQGSLLPLNHCILQHTDTDYSSLTFHLQY